MAATGTDSSPNSDGDHWRGGTSAWDSLAHRQADRLEEILTAAELHGALVTQCAYCKRVCVDSVEPRLETSWMPIGGAAERIPVGQSSHGICPTCLKRLYPGIHAKLTSQ